MRTVAGRLGHADAAMTLRVYAHAVEDADRALAGALGHVLDDGGSLPDGDEHGVRAIEEAWTFSLAWAPIARPSLTSAAATASADSRYSGPRCATISRPRATSTCLSSSSRARSVSLFDMARMEMELEEIIHDHRVDLRTAG